MDQPKTSDMNPHKPVAFAVKQTSDANDPKNKYPCHKCGQVGRWRRDCQMGSDVDNRKQEAAKDETDGNQHDKNKNKNKKKTKHVNFSNRTVEETF